jgi:hypothetical protein
VVIPIPRHIDYFEVGAFAICTLYGVITLIRYDQLSMASPLKQYPGWGGIIYLALLTVGGATGLAGHALRSLIGLKLELAGLTLLVLLCLAYTLWTPFSVGWAGTGLLLFMGMLVTVPGFFARRRLSRYIDKVEAIQRDRQMGGEESGSIVAGGDPIHRRSDRRWWHW